MDQQLHELERQVETDFTVVRPAFERPELPEDVRARLNDAIRGEIARSAVRPARRGWAAARSVAAVAAVFLATIAWWRTPARVEDPAAQRDAAEVLAELDVWVNAFEETSATVQQLYDTDEWAAADWRLDEGDDLDVLLDEFEELFGESEDSRGA